MSAFDDLVKSIENMDESTLEKLKSELSGTPEPIWKPQPGPQTEAFLSDADMLLYGGAAGGGKTDLIVGLALTQHERSGVFRQHSAELSGVVDRMNEICFENGMQGVTGTPPVWKGEGKKVEFGHLALPGSEGKWQGKAQDLKAFDEAAQQSPSKIIYVSGWNRSTTPGQRVRIVLASNPPLAGQGNYLIEWFAPWLDPTHERYPAKHGKLLWALFDGDGDDVTTIWCDGPDPVQLEGWEKPRKPESRTFIPAKMEDNKYLGEDYEAKIESMPEPMRSALRDGNFMAARQDHEYQVIPTDWVNEAVKRYEANSHISKPMLLLSSDIARGGADASVVTALHINRFEKPFRKPGSETPTGQEVVDMIVTKRRNDCAVVVDMGGGWGGSPCDKLKQDHDIKVFEFVPSGESRAMDKHKNFGFINARAEAWWKFRESIDPDSGEDIELPADPRLIAQLTTPRYEFSGKNIKIELKEDIKKRIGSSTDEADTIIMGWYFRNQAKSRIVRKRRPMNKQKGWHESYNPLANV
ncbi:MAG: terminase [Desulfobacteraceae bacterium]|nr:terminase [Desulfobacteraceae bacterium]